MLARSVAELPTGEAWVYQPKLDGWRSLLSVSPTGTIRLTSRQHRQLAPYFPDLIEAARVLPPGLRLDGELVIPCSGGVDFAALQRRIHPSAKRCSGLSHKLPAPFVAFDLLTLDGQDLRQRTLDVRRAVLTELLYELSPSIGLMPQTDDADAARVWMSAQSGVEGCVAKRRDQVYKPGKRAWRKLKRKTTAEAVVGGVFGEIERPGALILGRPDVDGRLRVIGRTAILPPVARVELGAMLTTPAAPHPWPETLPASRFGQLQGERITYTPVEPSLVVEFIHDSGQEHGRFRHATTYVRPRLDLQPGDLAPVR